MLLWARVVRVLVTSTIVGVPPAAPSSLAIDFSTCASALEDVSGAGDDAATKARDAEEAADDLESERDEYDRCRRFPDIYDLLQDGCRSKLREVKNAQEEFESAQGDLTRALDDLNGAMTDVQDACGVSLVAATPVPGVSQARQRTCSRLRKLRATMKAPELDEFCRRFMSEVECNACLKAP